MMYFESDYIDIDWNEKESLILYTWKGYASGEPHKLAANKALELMQTKKAAKIVFDSRNAPVHTKEDEEWINTVWFPNVLKTSLKKMAVVVPEKAVQKGVVHRVVSNMNDGKLQMGEFSSVEDALEWAKS